MGLGKNLSNEFKHRYSMLNSYREKDLFGILIDSFLALTTYDVTEIHGGRTIVEYAENQNWFTKRARCELADVFFIVYSLQKNYAKYFVMQNKRQKYNSFTAINANLVQYELLAKKQYFEYVRNHVKSHLLDLAGNDSVCVYGNFYESSSGVMDDMAVFTASKLVLQNLTGLPATGKNPCRQVVYTGNMDDLTTMNRANGTKDFEGTDNLEKFGDLVEHLKIGEPVSRSMMRQIGDMLLTLPQRRIVNNCGKTMSDLREELGALASQLGNGSDEELVNDAKKVNLMRLSRKGLLLNVDEISEN